MSDSVSKVNFLALSSSLLVSLPHEIISINNSRCLGILLKVIIIMMLFKYINNKI